MLDDCTTQRNLDVRGTEQAGEIGAAIHAAGVTVATAVPNMPVDGRCEDVIFFDGVFFEPSLTSIFFAP